MRVLVQNLQKRSGLATELFNEHDCPEVMLVQEINLNSESYSFQASSVSSMGYGTAIGSKFDVSNVTSVLSPYAEFGGIIHKKTTVASIKSIQFVSFHGYNGQPFKNIDKLIAHVEAVLAKLSPGPALFAGDFNSWSPGHMDRCRQYLESAGFHLAYSWPYPGRDQPLDHAFLRGLELKRSENYTCLSDHKGAILELELA
mmetsp:Transcript_22361/g.40356  ORF Transcript_22361/g.40356 Transcript_22361/m.40356 type:complete len:200 (+) Transcript_22361:63-662(+)